MSYNPNEVHVVYASDDNFAEILGISIVSLYENNKDMDDIVVYVLDSGIQNEKKNKMLSVCKKYGRTDIQFIPIKNISEKLSMNVYIDRGSICQYARIFVSTVLPKELKRVLYLDCDIIIRKSIRELWNLELCDKTIGALMDAFSKYYRANIDLEEKDIMFNSGVMIIDLDQWKKRNIEEQLLKFIAKKNGMVQQGDQGVLNTVLSKDMYPFSPRYNLVTNYAALTYEDMIIYRKPVSIYSKEEIELAKKNPCIVHYTSSFMVARPWEDGREHPYKNLWFEYKELSPWGEEIHKEKRMKSWKKMYVVLSEKMPYRVNLICSGILQAYVRPIYGKWKYRITSK